LKSKYGIDIPLDYWLDRIIENPEDDIAGQHIVLWIIGDFNRRDIKPTDEQIVERHKLLVTDRLLTLGVEAGDIDVLIDENGRALYQISEQGKETVNDILSSHDDSNDNG